MKTTDSNYLTAQRVASLERYLVDVGRGLDTVAAWNAHKARIHDATTRNAETLICTDCSYARGASDEAEKIASAPGCACKRTGHNYERIGKAVAAQAGRPASLTNFIPQIAAKCKAVHPGNYVLAAVSPDGQLFLDEMVGSGHSLAGAIESRCFPAGYNAERIDHELTMAGFHERV